MMITIKAIIDLMNINNLLVMVTITATLAKRNHDDCLIFFGTYFATEFKLLGAAAIPLSIDDLLT